MSEIILKGGRDKSVKRLHPWIFSGAVAKVKGAPRIGETVDIVDADGDFLARGAYNPNSNIISRIWTWDPDEQINYNFFYKHIAQALEVRHKLNSMINSDSMRIVHGESDGIPGLVVDQYKNICVVQFLSAGVELWKDELIDIISKVSGANVLYERSDVDVRNLEGLQLRSGNLVGSLDDRNIIIENDVSYYVDIISGHKTGFYLDQRENRLIARNFTDGAHVLDCFSYTGGFAINSLLGGAKSVTLVDSSADALSLAKENILLNNLSIDNCIFIDQDVFLCLRQLRDRGIKYDLIVLDPPKLAPTAAHAERAARAYKDINLLSLKLLNIGGYLLTFSCSGGISEDLFQKIVYSASVDANVKAIIIKRLHQAIDHPVALNFPEGTYLKGFIIQKLAKY